MIIKLNEMVFYGFHGTHDEERSLGQRFVVSARLHTDPALDKSIRHLEDTIDYTNVYADIRKVMETQQFHLLEVCANVLADLLIEKYPLLCRVELCIKKPSVPIQGTLASVEVQLCKDR